MIFRKYWKLNFWCNRGSSYSIITIFTQETASKIYSINICSGIKTPSNGTVRRKSENQFPRGCSGGEETRSCRDLLLSRGARNCAAGTRFFALNQDIEHENIISAKIYRHSDQNAVCYYPENTATRWDRGNLFLPPYSIREKKFSTPTARR
jgi:hypothetical protein